MAQEPEPPASASAASQAEQIIEIDEDSAYDDTDDIGSITESLTSTITDHVYENGRRYHAYREGKYIMPNDEHENDRLDMHHHLATIMLKGRLHVVPLQENMPISVLDLGTGTGIWAIEMGDAYPLADIKGVDLSPIQPTFVPPNVHFEVDDVEENWTYHRSFDFIHIRFLAAAIADWPKLVGQAYTHLKPGGWVEFKDWDMTLRSPDNSLHPDSSFAKHHKLLCGACETVGRTPYVGVHLKEWAEVAGFINVQEEIIPVPIGTWAKDKRLKEIGAWNYVALLEGLEAITMRPFTAMLKWTAEEVQVLLAQVRQELKNPKLHTSYTYYVVWGQKPPEKDTPT